MEWVGFLAAALMGVSLGLIGGGGSILTVPILVYLFQIGPLQATSYSLFIVGTTSLAGAIKNFRRGEVDLRTVGFFGASSLLTVLVVRNLLLPLIPDPIILPADLAVPKPALIMILFALLMLFASFFMIRRPPLRKLRNRQPPFSLLLVYGVVIGTVTGLLGAGGGFLLIPALVLLIRLPMRKAIGTSLSIIAITSLTGFAGDLARHAVNWPFLLTVTAVSVTGILLGSRIGRKIAGQNLRKAFGWFVLLTGVTVLVLQILSLLPR